MPVDPVCSMTVTRDGETYYFCSQACRELFEQEPDRLLTEPHPHPAGRAAADFEFEIDDPATIGVGDRVTFTKTITDEDVQRFAEATSDTNALTSTRRSPSGRASAIESSTGRSSPG